MFFRNCIDHKRWVRWNMVQDYLLENRWPTFRGNIADQSLFTFIGMFQRKLDKYSIDYIANNVAYPLLCFFLLSYVQWLRKHHMGGIGSCVQFHLYLFIIFFLNFWYCDGAVHSTVATIVVAPRIQCHQQNRLFSILNFVASLHWATNAQKKLKTRSITLLTTHITKYSIKHRRWHRFFSSSRWKNTVHTQTHSDRSCSL